MQARSATWSRTRAGQAPAARARALQSELAAYSREVHLVEVGADDYLDFPEDLAAKLIAAA